MRQTTGGRRPRGRPNRKQHLPLRNQTFDSNGPDVRVRGNAHQVYEKYLALARDATASGDRIAAEGFYQFAEHYYRILNASTDPERAQPDGQAPRRDRQPVRDESAGRQPYEGSPPVEAGEAKPPASGGNGVDGEQPIIAPVVQPGDEQPEPARPRNSRATGDGSAEDAAEAAPASPPRRRAPRRAKREGANGSTAKADGRRSRNAAAKESKAEDESNDADDVEPVAT